jgi:Zn-dependent M28 family amino/carboxypeptidase
MQLRSLGAAALAAAVLAAGAGPAFADDDDRRGGRNDTSAELRKAVAVNGIKQHEILLHLAGLASGGNRLSGTPGYDASALYVANRARRAGLNVSTFEFDYFLRELGDWKRPILDVRRGERFIPGIAGSIPGGDFGSMVDSPSGDITAPVWAADLTIPSPAANTSTSGCEAQDFAGMPQGAIAILQRGFCGELTKMLNAQAAGAGAIIYINEGDSPDRTQPRWFLMTGSGVNVPITAAQIATVERLIGDVRHGLVGKTVRFRIEFRVGTFPTRNVIAETKGGDPDKVIVVGAHLDSVGTGTGINDNGSGSSTILEIAEQLRGVFPRNKIRFMWFGAEESGLLGSEAYVASLDDAERRKIAAMLNFDMIGSPNFVRFVYDGDLSDSPPISEEIFAPEARPFSAEIENVFLDYFGDKRLANEPTDFDGRSDYGPFIAAGVPAGGLFTGAEGIKTDEQAEVFGGTAGEQYDPCYHLGCDDLGNLSNKGLDQMSDAAAHATITLAQMRDIPDRPAPSAQALRRALRANGDDRPEPVALDASTR